MKQRLDCVLLIDDDEPTNYLNEMIVSDSGCAKKIVAVDTAAKALDYLRVAAGSGKGYPQLIFLDVNMPGTNGWEFLQAYQQQAAGHHREPVIIMMTTSVNPHDKVRSETAVLINEFYVKPLSKEILEDVLKKYFDFIVSDYHRPTAGSDQRFSTKK